MENIRGTYDALNVRRVFGDAVRDRRGDRDPGRARRRRRGRWRRAGHARVATPDTASAPDSECRRGRSGVYEVRGSNVVWKPAIDVTRLARGGQVLGGIVVVCATLVLRRRCADRRAGRGQDLFLSV